MAHCPHACITHPLPHSCITHTLRACAGDTPLALDPTTFAFTTTSTVTTARGRHATPSPRLLRAFERYKTIIFSQKAVWSRTVRPANSLPLHEVRVVVPSGADMDRVVALGDDESFQLWVNETSGGEIHATTFSGVRSKSTVATTAATFGFSVPTITTAGTPPDTTTSFNFYNCLHHSHPCQPCHHPCHRPRHYCTAYHPPPITTTDTNTTTTTITTTTTPVTTTTTTTTSVPPSPPPITTTTSTSTHHCRSTVLSRRLPSSPFASETPSSSTRPECLSRPHLRSPTAG